MGPARLTELSETRLPSTSNIKPLISLDYYLPQSCFTEAWCLSSSLPVLVAVRRCLFGFQRYIGVFRWVKPAEGPNQTKAR